MANPSSSLFGLLRTSGAVVPRPQVDRIGSSQRLGDETAVDMVELQADFSILNFHRRINRAGKGNFLSVGVGQRNRAPGDRPPRACGMK